jgi:hypothetical protein
MHFTRKNHTFILIAAFVLSFSLAASCFAQAPPPGGPEGFGHGRHGGPGRTGWASGSAYGPSRTLVGQSRLRTKAFASLQISRRRWMTSSMPAVLS